ncbi:fungal-specific transcription factor domain-containing protein [Rhodocollybia butyracea]|uniref:Fungal-specific transcription factor domain-containing protein n=1 Tax=Rhodocollybia butyracea TaxID=206335 RepID=A0A9P5PYN6_9AGAR|nr:fungal-specific transcription factor domain-containing protein [Rhodocollybia butyracea]
MDWQESDSEDGDIPETQAASGKRSRSSRACDNCRKTKSKCERGASEGTPCKSCALSGTTCTFLGPSFKRGPPKGYIRAIEQRWHQVESLLGVILQCTDPRVQGVVADLRRDDLAREILNRVDQGPYGPSGRRFQPQGATKEDFFASVLRSNGSTVAGRDQSRSRRQSRVSREKVSLTQDRGLSIIPTQDWQDNLATRLCSSGPSQSYNLPASSTSDGPATQRRRLDSPTDPQGHPNWNDMYTFDAQSGDEKSDEITEGMGELSLTENQEIRYHGKTSGLQFLSKNNRTDDRVEGGVWKMPMARVWPPSKQFAAMTVQEENIEVTLPPIDVQTNLVDLYFSYIHPVFPVINKSRFLSEFNARINGQTQANTPPVVSSSPKPESSQKVTNLLLLTMFSITARFCGDEKPSTSTQMWEGGAKHFEQAMIILTKIIDRSRPSTVQSLLLLGYREFGLGSMEQGWIYIGMAIRMAIDLGLHRNSDSWKQHSHNLFSKEETQTRRQIWWSCCLADRYGSVYMGRPIIIRDEDFDTPLPEVEEEDQELWSPLASDSLKVLYSPTPCHTIACQRATGTLILILGRIITKLYPITVTDTTPRRTLFHTFEMQLDQWYLNLPDGLRYDVASKRNVPPPQVLLVHIRYWGTVLLLNRAFIPNWRGIDFSSRRASLELKAFDLAQGAATHLSAIVTAWRETFTLKRCSPFLTAYMLSTGIMHLLTLTLRPSNVQASHGLRQCLEALQEMAYLWPSASRAKDLLSGVRLGGGFDTSDYQALEVARTKRQVDEAFGTEKTSDYSQRELFPTASQQPPIHQSEAGVADLSQQIMAHMLGLDVPGVEPSTSYYPGYEWWPRHGQQTQAPMAPPNTTQPRPSGDLNAFGGPVGWMPDSSMNVLNPVSDYNYNYNQYSQYGQL